MLRLQGEGTEVALKVDPKNIDLGTIGVGFPVQRQLTLMNQSDGVLYYAIECEENGVPRTIERIADRKSANANVTNQTGIGVYASRTEGTVAARWELSLQ